MFYVTKYSLIIAVGVTLLLIVSLRQSYICENLYHGLGVGCNEKKFFGKTKGLALSKFKLNCITS